jgi:hypothetical protein
MHAPPAFLSLDPKRSSSSAQYQKQQTDHREMRPRSKPIHDRLTPFSQFPLINSGRIHSEIGKHYAEREVGRGFLYL